MEEVVGIDEDLAVLGNFELWRFVCYFVIGLVNLSVVVDYLVNFFRSNLEVRHHFFNAL